MSAFPRKVPRAYQRPTTTSHRVLCGVVMASPVVTYAVGEYYGWWKWMEPPAPGTPQRDFFDTIRGDIEAERNLRAALGGQYTPNYVAKNLNKDKEIDDMPIGIKEYIKNPEIKELKVKTVDLIRTWNVPKEQDALVFTSSKKDEQEKVESNEAATPAEVSTNETNKSEPTETSSSSS